MSCIIINEKQETFLINKILKESTDDYVEELGPKRLELKKFLDSNFKKGSMDVIGDDGEPSKIGLVVMVRDGKPIKSMDDKMLFYYIQSHKRFRNIVQRKDRDEFLKDTIIAWYNNEITKNGNIVRR